MRLERSPRNSTAAKSASSGRSTRSARRRHGDCFLNVGARSTRAALGAGCPNGLGARFHFGTVPPGGSRLVADEEDAAATGTAAQARRGTFERGSVPRPSPCHPTASRAEGGAGTSRAEPCRRATSPRTCSRTPPRGAAPPQDEMRFHRVIILKPVAQRDAFGNCGPPQVCFSASDTARSGHVPVSCPSLACQDLHSPCEARTAGDTALPSKKSG